LVISLKFPTDYPLSPVKVAPVNRIAVPEKKLASWLLTISGAIAFSSLTDGLSVFRRNVVGQMKGQSECAICYSIVGSDKKLPDKRCGTCKHLFHGACLFRWFESSNQSSCPLCRNPFGFGSGMGDAGRRAGRRGGPEV
jgi:hypothetical protein